MAQGYWEPSMGVPELEPYGCSADTFSYSIASDGGVDALAIVTSGSSQYLDAAWPGVTASTGVEVYADYRVSATATFRHVGVFLRHTGSHVYRTVQVTGTTDLQLGRGNSCAGINAIITLTTTIATVRKRVRARVENVSDFSFKNWAPADSEPDWEGTATNTQDTNAGKPGVGLRVNSTQTFYLYAFGYGTDGDPAPTGPVDVSAEPFRLRHNPRTNKVIPTLTFPTVTDIGANCVRPRVTKGY